MELKEYLSSRILKNKLPIDIDETVAVVETYETIYNVSYEQRFYQYLLNVIGEKLADIDLNKAEVLGWLKPHKGKTGICYYQFESEEDYINWLSVRAFFYSKLDTCNARILNFIELSTMDFISDIYTECQYMVKDNHKTILFNKTKYGVDVEPNISFMKYISTLFGKGCVFFAL